MFKEKAVGKAVKEVEGPGEEAEKPVEEKPEEQEGAD